MTVRAVLAGLWPEDRDHRIAWAIGSVTLLGLLATAQQGFVRDEGYYFRAAELYAQWFEALRRALLHGTIRQAFSDATLQQFFGFNTEHPAFIKLSMALTWTIFHRGLGWLSQATSLRLGAMWVVAAGVGFTYLLGAKLFSRAVGLLAAGLLLACPHVFYHSHLAAFDAPIMALSVAVTYGFWRSLSRPRWVWATGVLWGLALATKHNAVFLALGLVLAWVLACLRSIRSTSGERWTLPAVPLAFVAMAVLGPVVLYVLYPFGWPDPWTRILAYYRYHWGHENYPVEYFGTLYYDPPFPWSYPWVMAAFTIPLPVLLAGVWGLLRVAAATLQRHTADDERWRASLLLVSTLLPPLVISLPTVPIFGGTKHWMAMMPFFCLLAAVAVHEAAQAARQFWRHAPVVLVIACLALPTWETWRTAPCGHAYYNELLLGPAGAAALGLPRTFWGGDGRALVETLNRQAQAASRVFTHRMNHDDFLAYQQDGLIRADLRWTPSWRDADWAFVNHQREYQEVEYQIWEATGVGRPAASYAVDDIVLVSLYRLH